MKLYRAFLVRCWQEGEQEPPAWRFVLLEIGAAPNMRGFADFDALVAYLLEALSPNTTSATTPHTSVTANKTDP